MTVAAERIAIVAIGTGTDADGPLHGRCWAVPLDEEALEQMAATLTEAYGKPREWVSDRTSGQPAIVFFGAENG